MKRVRRVRRQFAACHGDSSVIIDDFHVVRIPALPAEANTILVVDADAVLPAAVAFQRFKTVAGQHGKVLE